MASINLIKASSGSGNASVATVQNVRAPLATTILVDTVQGIPTNFCGSMGTPHTFIDPVTSEEITVISEATAVDFIGHVDGSNLEIDTIAPGYTDNGSAVGDIIVIRPTTQWADNIATLLAQALEDSGAPKNTILNPTGMISPYAGFTAPSGWLMCDGSDVSRSTYADLFALLNPSVGTFTVTIASPGVITLNAHGLETSDSIYITTTGALPTGLTANTRYWVIKTDANTFRLATSQANADAGTAINTSGTQSGTHTMRRTPYGVGNGSTTFTLPDYRGRVLVGLDTTQTEFNTLGKIGGHKLLQAHTHNVGAMATDGNVVHGGSSGTNANLSVGGGQWRYTTNPSSGSTGGGDSQNLQPYRVGRYIIKT